MLKRLLVLFVLLSPNIHSQDGKTGIYRHDPFLNDLHSKIFSYFWETTDAQTGLTPDRFPTKTFCSVAAAGFMLTAIPIGIERGYISRDSGAKRISAALSFYWNGRQSPDATGARGYNGFFYHFLTYNNGVRFNDVELSSIDTALLLAGVLFCQSYFDNDTPAERFIRAYADSLYRRVNWRWLEKSGHLIGHGWSPEQGLFTQGWDGYSEAMILYILALGSPTFPLSDSAWIEWTKTYKWGNFSGYECVNFPPLFGHQYSHCWIDFRNIKDPYMKKKGIDYFENSRRATYGQREYGKKNPEQWKDYSDNIWGWSACDGPVYAVMHVNGKQRQFWQYNARGVSFDYVADDGTIAPTAAGGSLMFAPEICLPTLKTMKEKYGELLYRRYGFVDAFNPTLVSKEFPHGWFNNDYLGIDQGPILIAIENLQTELVWKSMRKNPYIVQGLRRAGFIGGWLDEMK